MKSVSVVIPNYNGEKLLKKNIPFIYKAIATSGVKDFEIIITDDDSKDASENFINAFYPDIIFIKNKSNKGFSCNMNNGIREAKKDLILLLNSDVTLTDEYFIHLLPYFEKEDTFCVGPKIIAIDSDKIQDGAKIIDYSYGNISKSKNVINKTQSSLYSMFVSGASLLVCRKKILELKGFNEIYNPYYSEDVDLGYRAWRLGYKCYFEEKAICKHPNSTTIKQEIPKKVKTFAKRNKMLLHYFHLNGIELAYYLSTLVVKTMGNILIGNIYYLNAFLQFTKKRKEAKISKQHFNLLQSKKQTFYNLPSVVSFIKKSNPKTENIFF